jgi:U1 small nuclear ribonucleoprotein
MNSHRKMTPKGHMSGNGSGPPIMMMPDNIRAIFMPDPPLRHLPPPKRKRPKVYTDDGLFPVAVVRDSERERDRDSDSHAPSTSRSSISLSQSKTGLTGVASFMAQFERTPPPPRTIQPTRQTIHEHHAKKKHEQWKASIAPQLEEYRREQRESAGEFQNMNCYNTLFVGRLAYEVTERKLLREFEAFGAVKDIKLVTVKGDGKEKNEREGKSRGYAFIEFEQEDDMKRAYRAADGMRIEGKEIVVDVERGHTVPNWLPRRFGGGLGGTRYVLLFVYDL